MPALLAVLIYWFRVLRRPMDARLKRRHVGSSAIFAAGTGVVVLWVNGRPTTLPSRYEWGELAGVMAVYLFTWVADPGYPRTVAGAVVRRPGPYVSLA
jgi:hypothetical protein